MFVIGSNSAATGYNLTRSLRFRNSASALLSRTNTATVTNNAVWTWSAWVKIGYWSPGNAVVLFGNGNGGTNECTIKFTNNQLEVINYVSAAVEARRITTAVFRDPSAWYHIVVASNSSTALNIYINGVQITSFGTSTGPSAAAWALNTASTVTNLGFATGLVYFDGEMAEVNFIDGQALTPSSFGATNPTTSVWQPIRYAGTYGLNGFYLTYNDPTSALTLGYDAIPATRITSGSGNYTIPAYSSSLVVECWGAGGGGAGTSAAGPAPTAGTGGATTFGSLTANGGIGGTGGHDSVVNGGGGAGGTASGGDVNTTGNTGSTTFTTGNRAGANGVGGGGLGGLTNTAASTVGPSGGGGNGGNPSTAAGGGGGSGGYTKKTYAPGAISGSISYAIGTGGTAGTGTSFIGYAGANGAIRITVDGVRVDNDWYPRNISVAAGATYDSMTDVPTLTSATAANFAVLNPLDSGGVTLTNGNLTYTGSASDVMVRASIFPTSGKWYWEIQANANSLVGTATTSQSNTSYPGGVTGSFGYFGTSGQIFVNTLPIATVATYTTTDVIGLALDTAANTCAIYKNNVLQTTVTSLVNPVPAVGRNGSAGSINFGQRPFTYTPPTGFVALNTFNISAGTVTTSGSFTGNLNADGPFVYLNGVPTAMTINGNAVTFGTNVDKLSNGFKVRSASALYNLATSNTYSVSTNGAVTKYANAQGNP